MTVKILLVILLLLIVGSLASALIFLMRDSSDSDRTARALTWRIGLSITAFLLLLLAGWTGLIEPNGIHRG
ncbi:MAG: twin transmembrane helix small protein [Halofilum sp. (in: g-proteobacteria)]